MIPITAYISGDEVAGVVEADGLGDVDSEEEEVLVVVTVDVVEVDGAVD